MAYCSFCNVDGIPDSNHGNTYCPFCGKLISEAKPSPPIRLYGSDEDTSASNSSYSNTNIPSGGESTSYSMRNRGTKTSDKGTEAFITVIILALLAWYFFGDTGGLIVLVIGFLYLLRDLIKLIAVPAVAIAGFFVAESMGINGIIGLIAAGIIAHFVINKLFRKK